MFEPVIVFHASNDVWKLISTPLKQNAPNELLFTLPDKTSRRIKCRPNLINTDDPPHFKTISCAPPTFVYCFTCTSKADYTNTIHDQIVKYYQQFEKKFNSIVPVFINDLNQNKGIFGGGSSIETLVRANYPDLQVITIEKNSNISTANIHHIWDSIMSHTHQAMTARIKILSDLIGVPQNKRNIETVRHFLRLIYIYSSLSLFDLQEKTMKSAINEIETHPQFFNEFIKSDELLKPIDAFNYASYQESNLTRELPSEFAMRQAFLRLKIHSIVTSKGEPFAVECAWDFYMYLMNHINKIPITDDYTNARIIVWLAQYLHEMAQICLKKGPVRRSYTFILNSYLNDLESLESIGNYSNLQFFPVVLMVSDQSALQAEKNRLLKCLFDTYLKLNLRRYALCMISRLSDADIINIDFQLLINTPLKGFTQYAPVLKLDHLVKLSTEMKIRLACRILCDCSTNSLSKKGTSLSQKGSSLVNQHYADFGASILNDLFGKAEDPPPFIPFSLHLPLYVKANLPVSFRRRRSAIITPSSVAGMRRSSVSSRRESDGSFFGEYDEDIGSSSGVIGNDDKNFTGFFVNQEVEIEFELFCDFGENTCFIVNKLKVGFTDQMRNMTYFVASNVIIKNHGRFKAKGLFKRPYPVTPCCLVFGNDFVLPFPNLIQVIHIKKSPPPFKFSMKLPDLLLPGLWQKATMNIEVMTPLNTLDINISGLAHRGEILTLQPIMNRKLSGGDMTIYNNNGSDNSNLNFVGEKRKASELGEGLSYSDIPVGHHQLNFQVFASKSGEVKTQVSSENHRVKKSTKFTVSEYLDLKIVYRKATKAAQLIVTSKQPCNITLMKVDFYDENENNRIICTPFGLPAKIEQVKTYILFLLPDQPDSADVWLQQAGLASFNLNLKIEQLDDDQLNINEPATQIPTTTLIPQNYEFNY